ncbi:MAG: hypothetical protein R6V46_14490 [Desulfatiglandaceae bacterium]|jgi:hypothetical protein
MRKIVISIVTERENPQKGKSAIHVEENGLESEAWYPAPDRKSKLLESVLNELIARSKEYQDPMVNRTIPELRTVKQDS